MTTILVVDDDHSLCRALSKGLSAHGYDVVTAMTGHDAIALAVKAYPDLLLVDLGLPQLSSIEVIVAMQAWSNAPIIVLSARPQEEVMVAALDAGSDDFLAKPFGINELLARIRAALERGAATEEEGVVTAGKLSIDLGSRLVQRNGDPVHLTPKEWATLAVLIHHRGILVSSETLLEEVWGPGYQGEFEYLRSLVSVLSQKLEDDPSTPRHLIIEPGEGYGFRVS